VRQSERKARSTSRPVWEQANRCGSCEWAVPKGTTRVLCPKLAKIREFNLSHKCSAHAHGEKRLWKAKTK
jgi:hypothetical protein